MFYSDEEKKKIENLLNDPKSERAYMTYKLGLELCNAIGSVGNMVQILTEAVFKFLEQQSQSDSSDDRRPSEQRSEGNSVG